MFEATQSTVTSFGVHTEALSEAVALHDRLVDPIDAYRDPINGEMWMPIWGSGRPGAPAFDRAGFRDEMELEHARNYCRMLAERNEYVINALENRGSYVVGEGHNYTVVARKGVEVDQGTLKLVQRWVDDWCYANTWGKRQREIMRRWDRDGEVFLRFFETDEGIRVRFVEPWQVKNPTGYDDDKNSGALAFGILTDPEDVETVKGYFIDGDEVRADKIQHRKANVDSNVRRGIPTFWPMRRLLYAADKVLLNLADLIEARSQYGVIRKLMRATAGQASTFLANRADYQAIDPVTGRTRFLERSKPGVHTTNDNVEILMPASNIGASDYEISLNLHLRAIASRLVMPIWMLTSNASEMAAYTASMVAESPSVRMFERLQSDMIEDDQFILWRVIRHGIEQNKLGDDLEHMIEVQAGPPPVKTRDELIEVQVDQVLTSMGVQSPQTTAGKHDLEYDQEQTNIEQHLQRTGGGLASPVDLLGMGTT